VLFGGRVSSRSSALGAAIARECPDWPRQVPPNVPPADYGCPRLDLAGPSSIVLRRSRVVLLPHVQRPPDDVRNPCRINRLRTQLINSPRGWDLLASPETTHNQKPLYRSTIYVQSHLKPSQAMPAKTGTRLAPGLHEKRYGLWPHFRLQALPRRSDRWIAVSSSPCTADSIAAGHCRRAS
jgi:hypothetical protein